MVIAAVCVASFNWIHPIQARPRGGRRKDATDERGKGGASSRVERVNLCSRERRSPGGTKRLEGGRRGGGGGVVRRFSLVPVLLMRECNVLRTDHHRSRKKHNLRDRSTPNPKQSDPIRFDSIRSGRTLGWSSHPSHLVLERNLILIINFCISSSESNSHVFTSGLSSRREGCRRRSSE